MEVHAKTHNSQRELANFYLLSSKLLICNFMEVSNPHGLKHFVVSKPESATCHGKGWAGMREQLFLCHQQFCC